MASNIVATLNEIDSSSFSNDVERTQAIEAARGLLSRLETPFEFLRNLTLSQPALAASLKVCLDLDLFAKWEQSGEDTITPEKAAIMTGSNAQTLERLLRHMGNQRVVKEVGEETYRRTPLSTALVDPNFNCWVKYFYDASMPVFLELPDYLRQHDYREPQDSANGVFQQRFNCAGQTLFDYYKDNPIKAATFNACMVGFGATRMSWLDFYPSERLIDDSDSSVLVDVGGNIGHDVEKFRQKHPSTAGRLVLQDLPDVVDKAMCQPPVKTMAHDFFKPQPVKGAKAYYMHSVLHDWSDDHAIQILQSVKSAMKPGYSRLLLNESVLATNHPHPQMTATDLTMMVKVAGRERSESKWRKLISAAGLSVKQVWSSPAAVEAVIESELVA